MSVGGWCGVLCTVVCWCVLSHFCVLRFAVGSFRWVCLNFACDNGDLSHGAAITRQNGCVYFTHDMPTPVHSNDPGASGNQETHSPAIAAPYHNALQNPRVGLPPVSLAAAVPCHGLPLARLTTLAHYCLDLTGPLTALRQLATSSHC